MCGIVSVLHKRNPFSMTLTTKIDFFFLKITYISVFDSSDCLLIVMVIHAVRAVK